MRSGIYLVLPLVGPAREQVLEVQARYDPRTARGWPPHVTLAGSSGMGPIDGDVPVPRLRAALEPVARETSPVELPLGPATRFMQTNVFVLPLDPHGPLRGLHERIRGAGLPYSPPRFAFTPHVTLSFYPELAPQAARAVLATRIGVPARFEELVVYRSFQNRTSELVMTLPLLGGERVSQDLPRGRNEPLDGADAR